MGRKIRGATIVAAAVLCAASAAAQTPSGVTVGKDWFDYGIRWTEGPPSYEAKWMVYVQGGIIVVCGAGKNLTSQQSQNRRILKTLGFFIEEDHLMSDMRFFASLPRREKLVGATAVCRSTGKRERDYPGRNVSLRDGGMSNRIVPE